MTRPAIDTGLMLPVTIQAPAHLDLDGPGDMRHGGHFAVAGGADEAGADMHHVREINVVRRPVDSVPGDRLLFFPILNQFLDFRSVLGDEQVAGPAISHCRDAGNRGPGSVTVTEEARDGVVACMHFMTEGDRLDRRAVLKIQRQNVQECQNCGKNSSSGNQSANKP